ncbi:hypothetical protein ACWGK5_27840 [Rhodococcus qingshengii]
MAQFSGQFPAPWLGLVQIVPSHGTTAFPPCGSWITAPPFSCGSVPAPWSGLVQIVPTHGADGWLSFEGVICDPAAPGLVRTLALGAGCKGSTLDWNVLVTEVVVTEVVLVVGRGDSSSSEHAVESRVIAAMNTVAAIVRITL